MPRWFFLSAALLLSISSSLDVDATPNLRLGADPDTTCSAAYRENPTREACLATKDHFGRPCSLCTDSGTDLCYNADQARWAKFFGASCEKAPDAVTPSYYHSMV
jgi:hypothetical protein